MSAWSGAHSPEASAGPRSAGTRSHGAGSSGGSPADGDAGDRLAAIEAMWGFYRSQDVGERFSRAYVAFGRPATSDDVNHACVRRLEEVQAAAEVLEQDDAVIARLNTLVAIVCRCREMLMYTIGLDADPQPVAKPPSDSGNRKREARTFLIDRIYEHMNRESLRIKGDILYAPISVNGRRILAWRQDCDVLQFVYRAFGKYTNEADYELFTGLGGETLKVHVHVINSKEDPRMRRMTPNRSVFSFSNGAYVCHLTPKMMAVDDEAGGSNGLRQRYYSYDSDLFRTQLLPDVAAIQHYEDLAFDTEVYSSVCVEKTMDFTGIPTPSLDSILRHQNIEGDPYRWFLFFLGRLLYDVGSVDNLQIIPFLLGAGGTGKSSILEEIVGRFYPKEFTGVIGNVIESKFGLWPLADCLLFYCSEVKADFQLNQSVFQQMVAGEHVSIAAKNLMAVTKKWTAPGILAGNEVFSYRDTSGSLLRRVVVFEFKNPVAVKDTTMPSKLHAEMPNIILKCNLAYHWGLNHLDGRDFWSLDIPYFRGTKGAFAARVDPLRCLLEDHENDTIVISPRNVQVYCTVKMVVDKLKEAPYHFKATSKYVSEHSIFVEGSFGLYLRHDVSLRYPRCADARPTTKPSWVFGLDVRTEGLDDEGLAADGYRMPPETAQRLEEHFGWA